MAALCLGLWLMVSAIYAVSSSGRLDTADSQYKFDVTASIIEIGEVRTRDPRLASRAPIALYPLGATLAGLPLSAIGFASSPPSLELAQFLWCLSTAFIAALIAPTLFWVWRSRGLSSRDSAFWALAMALATLIWPMAASSFDQTQHAWFLLVAVLLTHGAAERRDLRLGALAGFVFSAVLHYQPVYGVLILPLAVAVVSWRDQAPLWRKLLPALCLGLGALPGIIALAWFNDYRYGSPFILGPPGPHKVLGNPAVGALVLLVSPGKGILWFSPLIVLALAGLRDLWAEHRRLAVLIISVSATHFALVSCLSFAGGDWCWGPRYLAVTLPLVCLGLPYGARRISRLMTGSLILVSVSVQLLGLSVDHHRFYYEQNIPTFTWMNHPAIHFGSSQLASRPGEILDVPDSFARFSAAPYGLLTYQPSGRPSSVVPYSNLWVRQFAVFFWPRPWPLWIPKVPEARQFVHVPSLLMLFGGMFAAGTLMIGLGLRGASREKELPT